MGAAKVDSEIVELGFRALANGQKNPRQVLAEAVGAERLGLGSVFLDERLPSNEAATLAGAMGAVTNRLSLSVATASHQTCRPEVLAAQCVTMHKLTGGRFSLGLARGPVNRCKPASGDPVHNPSHALQMADMAVLLRRLLAGDNIADHDGPAGRFTDLKLNIAAPAHIPVGVVAADIETLEVGGRVFDSVMLGPYLSEELTSRCVATVRQGADRANRNPDRVRVWGALLIVGDGVDDEAQRRQAVGWLAGRLQSEGDRLVAENGWDPAPLERFRNDIYVKSFRRSISSEASDSELDHIAELIPAEWLELVAFGDPRQRAKQIRRQFDSGVDGVVLQGASPWDLQLVIDEYRKLRQTPDIQIPDIQIPDTQTLETQL